MLIYNIGAGTVLDAMRIDVPIIVVPNPALLDNHQSELAEELERQGYATYGRLRYGICGQLRAYKGGYDRDVANT